MDTKERIVQQAKSLFLSKGIRNVTMDDIASDLGISKKTLYQFFKNKAEILYNASQEHIKYETDQYNNFTRRADNALHELILILQFSLENMPKVSPLIVLEMRKYYPRAWRLFDDFRNDFILKSVRANLQKGIEEGLYRSNIQIDIVSAMHIAQTELAFNTELYPSNNYDIWQIHLQSFEMYLYGIVSKQGRIKLDNYLEQINQSYQGPRIWNAS